MKTGSLIKRYGQTQSGGIFAVVYDRENNCNMVEISVEKRKSTEKAFLVFDGQSEHWLPRSQVEFSEDESTVLVPEWLAKERGII